MGLVIYDADEHRTFTIQAGYAQLNGRTLGFGFKPPFEYNFFINSYSDIVEIGYSNTALCIRDIGEESSTVGFKFNNTKSNAYVEFNQSQLNNLHNLASALTSTQIQKLITYAKS